MQYSFSKLSNLNTHYTAKDYKTQKLGSYRQTQLDNLPVGKPQSRERRGDVFHSPTGVWRGRLSPMVPHSAYCYISLMFRSFLSSAPTSSSLCTSGFLSQLFIFFSQCPSSVKSLIKGRQLHLRFIQCNTICHHIQSMGNTRCNPGGAVSLVLINCMEIWG